MTDPPITAFTVHTPTATPSDIGSYYAKAVLSHSVSCVVCLLFFLYLGPSPHFGTTLEITLCPLSFGKSFMKIRSAVPENGCLIFCGERKKNKKKQKKTSVKHIRIRLIGGCVITGTGTGSQNGYKLDPCMGWLPAGRTRPKVLLNKMGRAVNFRPAQARFIKISTTHSTLVRSFQCIIYRYS